MATLRLGKEPGVYIQEEVNPALAILDTQLKVAGLVGHAAPTLTVADIAVTRGDGDTDTLPYAAGLVQEVLCASDYVNAYGTNLPQYVQLTAEEPTVDRPGAEPVEPTIADFAQDPENPTYEEQEAFDAAYAQWEIEDAEWKAAKSAWDAYDAAVAESDYSVQDNVITWLTGTGKHKPQTGYIYYVTAIVAKDESYYKPKKFADIEAVKAYYGPEIYTINEQQFISEITVGARLMFDNGADLIWICESQANAEGKAIPSNVKHAIDLMGEVDIQSLVVMYQDKEIQDHIKLHVVTASSTENQKERVGFVCALSDEEDDIIAQCKSFHEQRIVNVIPSNVTVLAEDASGVGQEFTVQSTFAAAAAVGMLVDNTRLVSEPLTRRTLTGIYGASQVYTRSQIEAMSGAGAFILKDTGGVVTVNQSVTTDISNQNNRELSVVLIKDEVMKDIRYNLDRDYIGKAYNRRVTPTQIKTSIMSILNSYVDNLIEGYEEGDIVVTADTMDSTRVNVKMSFAVLRPLNYIYISFMVTL